MSAHEYSLHFLVNELVRSSNVNLKGTNLAPEAILDYFNKNTNQQANTYTPAELSDAKRKLFSNSLSANEFVELYDSLKARHVRDLDSIIIILSHIVDNPEVIISSIMSDGDIRRRTVTPSSSTEFLSRPPWFNERLRLLWDFYPTPEKFEPDVAIGRLSVMEQEAIIVEDLLLCMLGIEGKFIKTPSLTDKQAQRSFHIDRSLDPTLRDLARRMVPLCSNHSLIVRFIEDRLQYKYGLINHALAGALREVVQRYYVFVSQLETQQQQSLLTLQTLWFHTEPVMEMMEVVANIVRILNKGNTIGRAVLDLLHEQTLKLSGHKQAYDICFFLAKSAYKPYLTMLETWIHNGLIDDPYGEFMVQENKDIIHHESSLEQEFNDKFWSRRYTLQRNNTPILFQSSSEMILNTGKYLNAIRESAFDYNDDMNMDMSTSILRIDKQLLMNNYKKLEYTIHEKDLDETLEEAYKYASEILLDLILNKYHLIERFQTLKHYFLIDKGDYIVQFMDSAEDELTKRARDIDENKIQSLLDVSFALTSDDPYKDDVRIKMFHYDLISMLERVINVESSMNINESMEIKLTGLESFSLDYDVKWPISLVINRNCLTRYQMLFRFLFYIKYIERLLCNVWRAHKNGGRRRRKGREKRNIITKPNGAAYLRHKMLHFVQNLLYYMSFEVIESHWHTFQNNLKKVTNIDELLKYHLLFLDNCLRDCMLTSVHLLRHIHKIMATCVMFANAMDNVDDDNDYDSLPGAVVASFNNNFTEQLRQLLDAISKEDGPVNGSSGGGQKHTLTNIIHR
ncbi:unnamed protein product [Adineta steineri]|uniref:Gamma-tubulin complex component n=1 Tax=Adineta steineri TaxID=433720 RepID=A0A814MIJ5_9BILA|nr:unnamed protein product [Adineta steineri]CAF1078456.1 unnamed protein product [Adineta steineri]CAF1088261.1 unnamed protein product [Adineta steineri]